MVDSFCYCYLLQNPSHQLDSGKNLNFEDQSLPFTQSICNGYQAPNLNRNVVALQGYSQAFSRSWAEDLLAIETNEGPLAANVQWLRDFLFTCPVNEHNGDDGGR